MQLLLSMLTLSNPFRIARSSDVKAHNHEYFSVFLIVLVFCLFWFFLPVIVFNSFVNVDGYY